LKICLLILLSLFSILLLTSSFYYFLFLTNESHPQLFITFDRVGEVYGFPPSNAPSSSPIPYTKLEDQLANIENKENQNDYTNNDEEDNSDRSRHIGNLTFTSVDPNDINKIWNNKENTNLDPMNLSGNDFLEI
jgi:hypothetical protein